MHHPSVRIEGPPHCTTVERVLIMGAMLSQERGKLMYIHAVGTRVPPPSLSQGVQLPRIPPTQLTPEADTQIGHVSQVP